MAKIVRLTESDLTRLVRRVIKESKYISHKNLGKWMDDRDVPVNADGIPGFDTDYDEEEFDDYGSFAEKHPERTFHYDWGGGEEIFNKYREKYGPAVVRKKRDMDMGMTESYLGRITRKVIMEEESPSYHLFVEKLDDIEEDMKKKNMTDEDLDDMREELENEKGSTKDSNNGLNGTEIKKLNKRISTLITKLRSKYKSDN
jgi:hypothetical protein